MVVIRAEQLTVGYENKTILKNLSLTLPSQKITTLIGPNGSGKSTLLHALSQLLPHQKGKIYFDEEVIDSWSSKQIAKKLSVLPQSLLAPDGVLVYDLVSYGRFPHQRYLSSLSAEDRNHIHWALSVTKTLELAQIPLNRLSGGQRQRVWIAMALAQDTPVIFLDEPTTYLDMNHQLDILELLQKLNQEQKKTIVMVLHDLNLAARFSDHMVAVKNGSIYYQGSVEEMMTVPVLQKVFHIDPILSTDPLQNRPVILSYQLLPPSN